MKFLQYPLCLVQTMTLCNVARLAYLNGSIQTVLITQSLELVCYVIAIRYVGNIWKASQAQKSKIQNWSIIMPISMIAIGYLMGSIISIRNIDDVEWSNINETIFVIIFLSLLFIGFLLMTRYKLRQIITKEQS